MTWPLPRINPPPYCCHQPPKFPPPLLEGIVVVNDTDSASIVVEYISLINIVQDDTEAVLIQLAFVPHYSLGRYP